MGVGFETTTPTIAAAIVEADARGLQNFSVYCAHKTTPPPLRAIAIAMRVSVTVSIAAEIRGMPMRMRRVS